MLTTGKILRFDEVRGYGFIAPHQGEEDVFMHANDLLDEKYLYQPGLEVEFYVEPGDRGPKAAEVRLVKPARDGGGGAPSGAAPARRQRDGAEDGLLDVLSVAEFRTELTEALLEADGGLTAEQIRRVRKRVIQLAQHHHWIEP